MIEVLSYMDSKNVAHRDLKLENILVDDQIDIKVADFGFATYKKINKLTSYKGTKTYMAPEIREGKVYDGRQIDMFSTGVILFIIVKGIFPFEQAKRSDKIYQLKINQKLDSYWNKVRGKDLSDEFKDLILKMVSYDAGKRPTISELKEHPWIKTPISIELIRSKIKDKLNEKRFEKMSLNTSNIEDQKDEKEN